MVTDLFAAPVNMKQNQTDTQWYEAAVSAASDLHSMTQVWDRAVRGRRLLNFNFNMAVFHFSHVCSGVERAWIEEEEVGGKTANEYFYAVDLHVGQ